MSAGHLSTLDLDLEVFQGPFDLLLALILNEEIDLLDVDLAGIVLAYIEHLEGRDELDLEAATEFLVLIAALMELKSRLLLPGEEEEGLALDPAEAAEELLARMLSYRRASSAASWLVERLQRESGYRFRDAPLPAPLRRVAVEAAVKAYEADELAGALAGLLRTPPQLDLKHIPRPVVPLESRLSFLRKLLEGRGSFTFDEAVEGEDKVTEAVTLFALLELYKKGELSWYQPKAFGPITIDREIRVVPGREESGR